MTIASAVQRGSYVYLYDGSGRQLAAINSDSLPGDGLQGYTGSTVSIRRGPYVYVYDENGRQISAIPAGR